MIIFKVKLTIIWSYISNCSNETIVSIFTLVGYWILLLKLTKIHIFILGCQGLQVCHWQVHPPEAPVHPAWCQDVLLQGPNHPVWSILQVPGIFKKNSFALKIFIVRTKYDSLIRAQTTIRFLLTGLQDDWEDCWVHLHASWSPGWPLLAEGQPG